MRLFHERNRRLVFLATLGGVYLPCVAKIVPYRPVQAFLKGYAVVLVGSLLFCVLMAARHTVFLADHLILRLMAVNNVFNDFLCSGRALLFNINRHRAQALYDMWDEFFTGDGHDDTRKKLVAEITRPNRKFILGSGGLIQFMLVSWAADQFDNADCHFSVPIGLPFNNKNPEYLIWAVFIFFSFSLFGPMLLSVDALIMEPLICISAEFVRLRSSLDDILGEVKVNHDGELIRCKDGWERRFANKKELEDAFAEVGKNVKTWIREHQKLLIFHKAMVEVNYWPLAIQLFSTTMTICLISFIVATNLLSPFDTFVALLFFVPSYILFYITSTYGDLVNQEAARVFDSAFATTWALYPKAIKKDLHIIAMRTNYSVEINIMKMYPLGSKTYFQIVQTAYSFYSFLRFLTSK